MAQDSQPSLAPDAGPGLEFLSPPTSPAELGWLGKYRVLQLLGEGGMGMVFRAEDSQLKRDVALKVVRPEIGHSLAVRERFMREARALAALRHDNVVIIYDVGQANDVSYMTMEFLRGESLEAHLQREGTPPLQNVVRWAIQTADGLAAAHDLGLIHRDIKPANLWLESPSDRIKILDFGLVRPDQSTKLTGEGRMVGTPGYMSPEQITDKDVSPKVDLYSLGCVMYQLCSGVLPFEGSTASALLTAPLIKGARPLGDLCPNLPEPLRDLIMRLLAADPDHRPASAAELVTLLKGVDLGSGAPDAGRSAVAVARSSHTSAGPSGRTVSEDTLEAFVRSLVLSRLIGADEAAALRDRFLGTGAPPTPDEFAGWLVANRYLTAFQRDELRAGRAAEFFIGEYKILNRMSEGRFAGLYRASHRLGQAVSIKVLPADSARDPEAMGRFRREVRAAVRLKHPNVVRTFQSGEADGTHFLVMENLEGETLADVLGRRKNLPPAEAVYVISQALRGLDHLHAHGVVHRDLKPVNLMLAAGPESREESVLGSVVKILDIGLGRELVEAKESLIAEGKLTGSEAVLGTPEYMAPEQARDASAADVRSDLYSLGCVLFQLLAGRTVFTDRNPSRQLLRHATEPPPRLATVAPDVPEVFQPCLDRLLAKNPADRYQTPSAAAAGLAEILRGPALAATEVAGTDVSSAFLAWVDSVAPRDSSVTLAAPAKPAPTAGPKPAGSSLVWIGAGVVVLLIAAAVGSFIFIGR